MNTINVTKQFDTEGKCLDYLEKMRWPMGVACLKCGSQKVGRVTRESKSKNKRTRLYECLERECGHQFSATSGTIFHDTHLPLRTWFMALALVCEAKKGISACQLQRNLGMSYRTAWYLAHRIREAMAENDLLLGGDAVETDEPYVGSRVKRPRHARRKQSRTMSFSAWSSATGDG
jgi:predicted  nucleic acid-binding Zn-ribbon protein